MKRGGKMLMCVVSGLALSALTAQSQDNPYEGIVARNLFGLKPPPAPVPPESLLPPPPTILLQGTTSILGRRQVAFKVGPPVGPQKAGEPAKETSYLLSEGQREDDIEVLEIDEKAGAVKFKNHDLVQYLTFEKNGAKPPAGAPPAPGTPSLPGLPPPPGAVVPPPVIPGGKPSPLAAAVGAPDQRTIPIRQLRLPTTTLPTPTAAPGLPGAVGQPAQPQTPTATPEEQAAIHAILNQTHQSDPDFPPLPQ